MKNDISQQQSHLYTSSVWLRFKAHTGALLGLFIFTTLIFIVSVGPFVWEKDPTYINSNAVELIKTRNQPFSLENPFGTDQLGRDFLARMIWGGQISIAVGLISMAISLMIGTSIGIIAGYYQRLDGLLMRLTDLFLALPLLPLLLLLLMLFKDPLSTVLGTENGSFILVVSAIGLTSWMQTARIVRGEVLVIKELEFITAARSIGTPHWRIILRHIIPNILNPIIVTSTLSIANAIITESALSFLGLGFPPDFPTWGRLLSDGISYMQQYPARVILPGLAISLTVLSINYIGDGLRDALDPRTQRSLK